MFLRRNDGGSSRKEITEVKSYRRKLIMTAVSLLVLFCVSFSVAFIIAESQHDCIGEDCAVCHAIGVAENNFKGAKTENAQSHISEFSFVPVNKTEFLRAEVSPAPTLVTLKTKLTN